ncbi:MAG: hypothetical protein NVV73_01920 [Cellvibrionaceae bacterium]|nr:hypothetical protein [Cellvibrionaceae bacterium]
MSNIGEGNVLGSISNLFSGGTKQAFDAFRSKVDASQVLGGKRADYLLEAFGEVGNAIVEVLSASISGGDRPTKVGIVDISSNVAVSGRAQLHTYLIKQNLNLCDAGEDSAACNVEVDLTVVLDFPRAPLGGKAETSTSLGANMGLMADITGVIKNGYLSAQLLPAAAGSHHVAFDYLDLYMDQAEVTGWNSSSIITLELEGMAVNIPVVLQQLGAAAPVSAELTLVGSAAELMIDVDSKSGETTVGGTTTTTSLLTADFGALSSLELTADAVIKDTLGESFELDASLVKAGALGAGSYRLVSEGTKTCTGGRCVSESDIEIEGETASNFINALVNLDFSAVLAGVDPVSITAAAQRASNELFSLDNMGLTSGDGTLDLSGEFDWDGEIASLNASNDAGLRLQITSNASGVRSGTLVNASGQKVADVVEEGGKIVIKYVNGTSALL